MRKIKFRGWDKLLEKMDYDPTVDCSGLEDFPINRITQEKHQILMQFTGLTDKHGKEIYEGDILEGSWFYESKSNRKFIVEYEENDNGSLCSMEARMIGGNYSRMDGDPHCYSQVIGNIYENPELLK